MFDFSDYEIEDLFKIRDALKVLENYSLAEEYMLREINHEIKRRNKL